MSVFMQPIFTQTVGATSIGAITFNNIPQGYTDLKILVSARTNNSAQNLIYYYVNGNQNTIYSTTWVVSTGSTIGSARTISNPQVQGGVATGTGDTANTFSNTEIYIPNYSGGNYKQGIVDGVGENNAAASTIALATNLIQTNAPITSLTIFYNTILFTQYSTFTLYGVAQQYPTAAPSTPTIGTVTDAGGFASVAFTPVVNDQATLYAVTGSDSITTYGGSSPITTPMTIGTATTYTVKAINSLGTSSSGSSSPVTTSNSYSSIASQTIGAGGATSVVFNNIPQNYSHLQIRVYGFTGNQDVALQFNADASSSYSRHYHYGSGAAVTSSGTILGGNNWVEVLYSSGNTTYAASSVSDILDYSSGSKNKVMRTIAAYDNNGTGYFILYSGLWTGLAPISSMTFFSNGSTLINQYTSIALYGMA